MNYKNIEFTTIYSSQELINIDLSQFHAVYSPSQAIDVSLHSNTKFIFGPHFSVFPVKHHMDLIKNKNSTYIQPSDWASDVWRHNILCNNLKIKAIPFGIDTNKFNEIKQINNRNEVFIYYKGRSPNDLNLIEQFLKNKNINYKIFSYMNRYDENVYLNYLQNSKYGIWIDAHESQGFALQEALSCGVPLLVWNIKSMNQEYGQTYDDIPATTIPYWDERCGEYFYKIEELEEKYNLFLSKIETYKPREFILENLSFDICEEKFINIINNMISNKELIEAEIRKHGNTNLITNSGLQSGSQIFAIGDSHTIFFYNSMKIKEHWFFGCILPPTIYRLLNEDIDIYNIGNILGNLHEKYNIKENDYVIFYFGFNDIQKNIQKYAEDSWQHEIINLFTTYINKVVELSNKYKIKPILPCIYPNPRPDAQGQNPCGSYEQRRMYTIFTNNILKHLCDTNKIPFLDIYNSITDEYGFIKQDITSDNIHLDYNNQKIRDFVEDEIYKLCC